jgi:hypothetical protein
MVLSNKVAPNSKKVKLRNYDEELIKEAEETIEELNRVFFL